MLEFANSCGIDQASLLTTNFKSIQSLTEARIRRAQDRLRTAEYIDHLFGAVFGAQKVSEKAPFAFGLERRKDECILAQIVNKVAQKRGAEPVKILKLGAGRTPGDFFHRGAPWLARMVKIALGELVEITVTDNCPYDLSVFGVDPEGILHGICLNNFRRRFEGSIPLSVPQLIESAPSLRFSGQTAAELKQRFPDFSEYLTEQLVAEGARALFDERREQLAPDVKFFFRPPIDAVFEGALFGLKAENNVDMEKVAEHFSPGSFDLVFARYQPPMLFGKKDRLIRTAEKLVGPAGVVVFT